MSRQESARPRRCARPIRRFGFAGLVALGLLAGARPALAAGWQDGAGPEWRRVLAAARQEGTVVVAGAGELAQPMTDTFKRDTGITLEWLTGDPREVDARIGREIRAHHLTIDVFFTGGDELGAMHAGLMMPLKPQLLLPGVTDPKNWAEGRIKWIDNAQEYFLIAGELVASWPLFNADAVKPGAVQSWKDMLRSEWKGKIAAYDPRLPGAGQAAAAYLDSLYGIDFVKALYAGQNTTLVGTSRQLVEWVARGVYAIGLGAVPTDVETFQQNGFKSLEVRTMKDGPGTLLGGSAIIAEAKGVPHPAAATVFLNWYLSEPGQEIFTRVWHTPSRRVDVSTAGVPPFAIPKPGVPYLDQYREDWYEKVRPRLRKEITNALGGL